MTVTGERLLLLRSVCISKPCPFTNPQCCYFKRPRPPKKKTFVKHIVSGSAILRSCPVSLHHMISFTRAINHPVRFKLSGLTCFGFFFFFFGAYLRPTFEKQPHRKKNKKNNKKKTKNKHKILGFTFATVRIDPKRLTATACLFFCLLFLF